MCDWNQMVPTHPEVMWICLCLACFLIHNLEIPTDSRGSAAAVVPGQQNQKLCGSDFLQRRCCCLDSKQHGSIRFSVRQKIGGSQNSTFIQLHLTTSSFVMHTIGGATSSGMCLHPVHNILPLADSMNKPLFKHGEFSMKGVANI